MFMRFGGESCFIKWFIIFQIRIIRFWMNIDKILYEFYTKLSSVSKSYNVVIN